MKDITLFPNQQDAVNRLHNACILKADVGTGKSITSLAYVFTKELGGSVNPYKEPTIKKDLYIITTAQKRDNGEWEKELLRFGLSTHEELSVSNIKVLIDSWNNVAKYVNVYGAMFIFDEQHAISWRKWGKSFVKIAKKNHWIMLTASPADSYVELMPVFIAAGYYKNKTDFNMQHVIFDPYVNYPKIKGYVNEGKLNAERRSVMVEMKPAIINPKNKIKVACNYDKVKYKTLFKDRWNYFDNCPIEETGKLCYLLRRCVDTDPSRIEALQKTLANHPRSIIFYSYKFEHDLIKEKCIEWGFTVAGMNGQEHEPLPTGDKWVYLCQYSSSSEGWNCRSTDTIIFYSLSYSYKQMIQAEGRIDRMNTPFKELNYIFLISYSPIDLAIRKALSHKRDFNQQSFIGG